MNNILGALGFEGGSPACPASAEAALTRPLFNRLTLFVAQPSSGKATGQTHAVLPVVRADASRYAVSGWFTEREQSRATDRVELGSNVHMVAETGRTRRLDVDPDT